MTWNWAIPVNTYFTEMPPTKSFSEKKIKNQFINGHINYNAKSLATLLSFSDYLTLIAYWMPWKTQMWLNHLALYYTF